MTLLELYQSRRPDGENGTNLRTLLMQTHWFTVNSIFDPKTGEALPQALSAFLGKVARTPAAETLHDRLWRITEHARPSVERLFRALNKSPRREHALLPVRAVRELDASSFIKLSNRPGRNIREKLADKPYLQAVRRFQSVNLPENRLLKALVTRLADLLELRSDYLGEDEDELLPRIRSWLLSDEARGIGDWHNLPPNNTLLSHRDYRRAWDAWRWLQTLDEDISRDFTNLEFRAETMRRWSEYGQMYSDGTYLLAEMPVLFDYEKFEVRPWLSQVFFQKAPRKITRTLSANEILEPVCVDLTVLRPRFATASKSFQALRDTYLWQHWKDDEKFVDIDLFNSDAAYLHPDATSISSSDLFFSKDNNQEHFDRAARTFALRLREVFKNDTLIWLVPDFLNDFELEIARRNINARFPSAEPLPRSVAAVFEQIDYSKIKNDGFPIVVVDTIGGKTCVTKLIARFDPELQTRIPETKGYYWERCPPVVISQRDIERTRGKEDPHYDIISVDAKGQWRDAVRPEKPQSIDQNTLNRDPRIGKFAFCINLTKSPVTGGIQLHALQQRAGDIPVWRDNIPELSIKGYRDGLYRRFYLVGKNTPVPPVRGKTVSLEINATFPLPKGKSFYSIPLYQGANAEELGFSVRLDSPEFPLKADAECELNLTFEYGADEPYTLIFTPLDKSFPPIRATWQRTEELPITDAPAPEYPKPLAWKDLLSWNTPQRNQVDLLDWLLEASTRIPELVSKRCLITTTSSWTAKKDNNGHEYWFTFARTDSGEKCYCNTRHLVKPVTDSPHIAFPCGTKFYCNIGTTPNGAAAFYISTEPNVTGPLIKDIRKSLYVPFINVWKDGRSTTDKVCPQHFAEAANDKIAKMASLLRQTDISDPIKCEFLFLLACLHKNTTDECVRWVAEQVESGIIHDPRAVGFALGDVSEEWQRYIFGCLASRPNTSALSVFAYAIWREQHFVERFSRSELQATLNALSQRLAKICSVKPNGGEMKDKQNLGRWIRAATETLELLLGLLRTRASTDPEIKMLLQPHQKITKELAKQVERVTESVAQSNVNLFSRVQLNLQKPAGDRTPNLLYALRLYLTGDDGANAIHITSVSDSDND